MGRPAGTSREGTSERRHQLALKVAVALRTHPDGAIRALARESGVSVATLQHHFGDRDGAIEAALVAITEEGRPFMARYARRHPAGLAVAVGELLAGLRLGWDQGLGATLSSGLRLGLGDQRFGPLFVNQLLEPMLQSAEALLTAHADQLPAGTDVRAAALALISPVMLALLHQGALSGDRCRPLALDPFVAEHLKRWLRGWAY